MGCHRRFFHLLLALSGVLWACDLRSQDHIDSGLGQKLDDASDSIQMAELLDSALQGKTTEEFRRLACDTNTNISVHAAWQIVMQDARSTNSLPLGRIEHFVGFLEGRIGVLAPEQWMESARKAEMGKSHLHFEHVKVAPMKRLEADEGLYIETTDSVQQSESKKELIVTTQKGQLRIPNPLFSDDGGFTKRVKVAEDSGGVVVLIEQDCGFESDLLYFPHGANVPSWKRFVWCVGTDNLPLGIAGGCADSSWIVLDQRSISIFGNSCNSLYVSAFERTSGKARLRFATNKWFVDKRNEVLKGR